MLLFNIITTYYQKLFQFKLFHFIFYSTLLYQLIQITEELYEYTSQESYSNSQDTSVQDSAQVTASTTTTTSQTNGRYKRSQFIDKQLTQEEKEQIYNIIKECMSKQEYSLFKEPVDPIALSIPDYPKIIKNPMDLTTLGQKLASDIQTSQEFFKTQALIWENCRTYNGYSNHSYFYNTANKCERDFVKRVAKICPIGMQMYKRMFVKPAQLKAEIGKKIEVSQIHKEGDTLQKSDYDNIVKMLLKLPETEMVKILKRFYPGQDYINGEQFDLDFNKNNDNQTIKFENAIIAKLKEIADYKAKNKRTYRKHVNE